MPSGVWTQQLVVFEILCQGAEDARRSTPGRGDPDTSQPHIYDLITHTRMHLQHLAARHAGTPAPPQSRPGRNVCSEPPAAASIAYLSAAHTSSHSFIPAHTISSLPHLPNASQTMTTSQVAQPPRPQAPRQPHPPPRPPRTPRPRPRPPERRHLPQPAGWRRRALLRGRRWGWGWRAWGWA